MGSLEQQYRDIFQPKELDLLHDRFVRFTATMTNPPTPASFVQSLGLMHGNPIVGPAILSNFSGVDATSFLFSGFISSMAIVYKGTLEQRLSLAFFLISGGQPMISKAEIEKFVEGIWVSLALASVEWDQVSFLKTMIAGLQLESEGSIASLNTYIEFASAHLPFLRSLGTLTEFFCASPLQPLSSLPIWIGDPHWELVQAICIGLRRALGEASALFQSRKQSSSVHPHHFETEVLFDGILPHYSLVDYAPVVFCKLRNIFGIAPREYTLALGVEQLFGSLFVGEFGALATLASTGRSGSFFLRSRCHQYLLKTLPSRELALFRSILPDYFRHLQTDPNSLLCRFFGMHQISYDENAAEETTLLKAGTRLLTAPITPLTSTSFQLPFVIMNNIFSALPIHEQYDLKGSKIDRTIGKEALLQADPNQSRKDLDLTETIHVGKNIRSLLLDQLERDTHLLCSHNICDYSLLVGIHRLSDPTTAPMPTENSHDRLNPGWLHSGIVSTDRSCIYFIGVVDILTQYDMQKRGERVLKSIRYSPNEISALPPVPYRQRFLRYVATIFD